MKPGIEPRIDFSLFFNFQSSSLSFTKEYEGTGRGNGLLCHESMKNMINGSVHPERIILFLRLCSSFLFPFFLFFSFFLF